jgi:hypothetical protein
MAAMNALNKKKHSTWEHKTAIVLPILFFIFTPLIMVAEKGLLWLEGERLHALILFEAVAVAQFVFGILMSRTMALVRKGRKEPGLQDIALYQT